MVPATWPCPLPGGGQAREYALTFDHARATRLLIVPALFDEGNRLRRLTVDVMRRLDSAGIDCFLPDLPGSNESMQPLEFQDTADWLDAMEAAARHFGATHALGMRGGCLFTPDSLPSWHYAPIKGAAILRQLLRARVLSSREAGLEEDRDTLDAMAREDGIDLAGYPLGRDFYVQFEPMVPRVDVTVIAQDDIGGSGMWLRAEPGENPTQADALAATLAMALSA